MERPSATAQHIDDVVVVDVLVILSFYPETLLFCSIFGTTIGWAAGRACGL